MTVTPEPDITDEFLLSTPTGFAVAHLGIDLYRWQADVLDWFEPALTKMVMGTLCTPNGAGKDAVIIGSLALWWIFVHKRGRVVITSKDARQIDEQTYPALSRHRGKFPDWKFIEREVITPTGGKIILFTTDDAGRAEGFHKDTLPDGTPDPEGPVLIIANEAKSIQEEIFTAFDRCTFNALLYASSAGSMTGRFYESHARAADLGFIAKKVGLLDCPHIPKEKIDRIIAQHGADSPKTRSILHGEFMLAEGEAKFDREGLDHLAAMAEEGHDRAGRGGLEGSRATGTTIYLPDAQGWLWVDEGPKEGGRYLITCDPNTCEQGEGTEDRDNTACCVIREAYLDERGVEHQDHVVAALDWPGGVKWDCDVLAARIKLVADWYGNAMAVVEANNFGSALIRELQRLGVRVWVRTKIDDVNPNKQLKIAGFLSTQRSREHWVQAAAAAVREKALVCRFKPATNEFGSFIILPSGRAEAQQGFHDDWVAAIGIGLVVRCFSAMPMRVRSLTGWFGYAQHQQPAAMSQFGACG